jgi:molecular chaperone GrpE
LNFYELNPILLLYVLNIEVFYMSKPHKPREEPKLRIDDLENSKGTQKQWPKDEFQAEGEGEEGAKEELVGILEHPSYIELAKRLTETEAEANEQRLRSQADLENIRRRAERDVANSRKYALEDFVNNLLPVVDSLDRASLSDVSDNEFAKKIHEGIELTMSLLLKTLEKFGVKQVNPLDEAFNPELHQAISTQPSDKKPNTILNVLQKGYLLNDRLIRPALVVVSTAG